MDANEYQKKANRTLIDKPNFELSKEELDLVYGAVQLLKHAGTIAEKIKKGIFHRHGLDINDPANKVIADSAWRYGKEKERGLSDTSIMLIWNVMGLMGEAGEIAETISDFAYSKDPVYIRQYIENELGDALWYIAALCTEMELDMGEVMEKNVEKLKKRYPDGYSSEDSKNRVDVNM